MDDIEYQVIDDSLRYVYIVRTKTAYMVILKDGEVVLRQCNEFIKLTECKFHNPINPLTHELMCDSYHDMRDCLSMALVYAKAFDEHYRELEGVYLEGNN